MRKLPALAAFLLLPACSDAGERTVAPWKACGLTAGMRGSDGYNHAPPACDLPSREEIAWACKSQEMNSNASEAMEDFRVRKAQCRFTGLARNSADCSFQMRKPGADWQDFRATLAYRFWADHGETHHFYYAGWSVPAACKATAKP